MPAPGQSSPKHRLSGEWVESSPGEEELGVLVVEKLNIAPEENCQCAHEAPKASCVLGCITRKVTRRSEEVILLLCSHEASPAVLCSSLGPQHTKDVNLLQ